MNENLSLGDMNTLSGDEVNKTDGQLLAVGDEIGGYKVIKQLGAGGMGQVYLVENLQMHKQYALKVLPPHLSQNQNFIDRFRVEARVMADLKNNNIVGVMNIGHEEKSNLYYLVMEYIESGEDKPSDLEVLLKEQKKLPEDEVLKITKQLCSALEYAHNFRGKGIVHRDLKPSNILLDADGNAHIADFGLAKVVGQDYLKSMIDRSMRLTMGGATTSVKNANMSLGDMNTMAGNDPSSTLKPSNVQHSTAAGTGSAGSLIGTYEYMAPEQQEGQEATVQSDIYSLGLIIYRMLTGLKAKGRFKLPSQLGYSESWDKIIDKSLEIHPEDRFGSVAEITALLDFDIKGKSKPATKKIKRTQSGKSGSGKKTAALLILLLVIIGIGIGGWYGYKAYDKNQTEKASSARLAQMKQQKQEKISKLTVEMNEAFDSKKYPEASKYANQLLSVDPNSRSAKNLIQKIINNANYKETAPVKVQCEYAFKKVGKLTFVDGKSKEQSELLDTLQQNLDVGTQFFNDKEYKSAMEYFQKILSAAGKIKEIESNYVTFLNAGKRELSTKNANEAITSFNEALKSKKSDTAQGLLTEAQNMVKYQGYIAEGKNNLSSLNWRKAEDAFNEALSITGYSSDSEAKEGLESAKGGAELVRKKAVANEEFNSVKEYITSSSFYGKSEVSKSDSKSAASYCESSLSKIAALEKNYGDYLTDTQKSTISSLKSEIINLKSKIKLLPSDLKEVSNATYSSTYGLASGSSQAQSEQKNAVNKTGLPLEVETAKYGIKMRLIPSGSFMMGSPSSEDKRDDDEGPQHKVTISKPFYMGKFEITSAQWKEVMGNNPSFFGDPNAPVERVSWNDCQEFLNKLCDKLGVPHGTYRLPTEAEWEYAARAGTTGKYYGYIGSIAWYSDNSGSTTHTVGTKKPNAYGLYDTIGNVWEWCSDWHEDYSSGSQTDPTGPYSGSGRVYRGGSWYINARFCRSAYRSNNSFGNWGSFMGFRFVRLSE